MKQAQFALVSALVVVLAFIAFDLHRLANVIAGPVFGRGSTLVWPVRAPETREERNRRIYRETQELGDDFKAMWDNPDAPKPSAKPKNQSNR